MFVPNVAGRIVISIEAIATRTTEEETLRATVRAVLRATPGTGLRGVPGVNFDHLYPPLLGFVGQERLELGKAPTMQTTLRVRVFSQCGTAANMGQVLKDNGTAGGSVLDNAFTQHMVMVSSLAQLFPAQFLEMPFCRAGAFCLKFSSETEDAPFLLFPAPFPQKLARGCHGRAVEAQIDPDHLVGWGNNRVRKGKHDMEGQASLTFAQIRARDLASHVLVRMAGNTERHFHTSLDGGKATGHAVPLDPGGPGVIADGGEAGMGDASFAPLFLAVKGRCDGFGCLDTGSAHQLRGKMRELGAKGIVGPFMQLNAIATLGGKPFTCHGIKARGMLNKRLVQGACLFRSWVQVYDYRSVHTKILSYTQRNCQEAKEEPFCPGSKERKTCFLPMPEAQGEEACRDLMIASISGTVEACKTDSVIIRVGGFGVRVFVPSSTMKRLSEPGMEVTLYTHFQVREDGMALYGFSSEEERDAFERLITVSGVGPKVALALLSVMDAPTLYKAIADEDQQRLALAPGVGKKVAARLVLELKGKLPSLAALGGTGGYTSGKTQTEVLEALIGLGFTNAEAQTALSKLPQDQSLTLEQQITLALRSFSRE